MIKKRIKKRAKKCVKDVVKKILRRVLPKFLSKGLAKKIPFLGVAVGAVYSIQKAVQRDWYGSLMELGSGVVSVFPGPGTAASVALDVGILVNEIQLEVEEEAYHSY